jgi:hypothetical protein
MHHAARAANGLSDMLSVANVADDGVNAIADVGVIERRDVERDDALAFGEQVASEVDSEEPTPAGDGERV